MDQYTAEIEKLKEEIEKLKNEKLNIESLIKELHKKICKLKCDVYIFDKNIKNYNDNITYINKQKKSIFKVIVNMIGQRLNKKILSFDVEILYWTNKISEVSFNKSIKEEQINKLEEQKKELEIKNDELNSRINSKSENLNKLIRIKNMIIDLILEELIEKKVDENPSLKLGQTRKSL